MINKLFIYSFSTQPHGLLWSLVQLIGQPLVEEWCVFSWLAVTQTLGRPSAEIVFSALGRWGACGVFVFDVILPQMQQPAVTNAELSAVVPP
jgi:hypothetical protein